MEEVKGNAPADTFHVKVRESLSLMVRASGNKVRAGTPHHTKIPVCKNRPKCMPQVLYEGRNKTRQARKTRSMKNSTFELQGVCLGCLLVCLNLLDKFQAFRIDHPACKLSNSVLIDKSESEKAEKAS